MGGWLSYLGITECASPTARVVESEGEAVQAIRLKSGVFNKRGAGQLDQGAKNLNRTLYGNVSGGSRAGLDRETFPAIVDQPSDQEVVNGGQRQPLSSTFLAPLTRCAFGYARTDLKGRRNYFCLCFSHALLQTLSLLSPDSHFSFDSANHRVASDAFIYAGWKALKALRRSTPNG